MSTVYNDPSFEPELIQPTDIITVEEVAQYLRVRPKTVYVWAEGGKLPGHKVGRFWRFLRSEVSLFIKMGPSSFVTIATPVVGLRKWRH